MKVMLSCIITPRQTAVRGAKKPRPIRPAIEAREPMMQTALEQAHDAIAARLAFRGNEARDRRRQRLAERIRDAIDFPAGFHRSVYFRHLPGGLATSAEEACTELCRCLRAERARCRKRHWSAKPERIEQLREALTFARFIRRFERQRMAEAA